MKKSTIIILIVVFLGSVIIVGMMGSEVLPYNERVYVKEITPTSVILNNSTEVNFRFDQTDNSYYARINYDDGLIVYIGYDLNPRNASNRDVNIKLTQLTEQPVAKLLDNGAIEFSSAGNVKVTVTAKDQPNAASMTFYLYVREAKPAQGLQ